MSVLDDYMLLYRVATYYYKNDYSQSQIAQIENISRAQISRLLKKAKECNIVKIEVSMPEFISLDTMCNMIREKYHFQNVMISPHSENEKNNDDNLYSVASAYLEKNLCNCQNVGIGSGKTLYQISTQLSSVDTGHKCLFCPLAGNSGTKNPYLQATTITDRFSEHFHANTFYNNLLLVEDKESLSEINLKRLADLRDLWEHLDAAVIGLGGRAASSELYIEELSSVIYSNDIISKIAGDILGHFFLDDGSRFILPEQYLHVAIPIENLKKIPKVICVAHGRKKVDAIKLISQFGIIKTLITDEDTAKLLIC